MIEALAAALVNDLRERLEDTAQDWSAPPALAGLCEDGRVIRDFECRLGCVGALRAGPCRSLTDPTRGANAFHRIEASPDWARELLPVAVYGPYFCLPPLRSQRQFVSAPRILSFAETSVRGRDGRQDPGDLAGRR